MKTNSAELAQIRFEDLAKQEHLIDRVAAPRFGKFVEGKTRLLTYVAGNPAKWEWGRRQDQRSSVFGGGYLVLVGLGFLVAGAIELLP